MLIVLKKSQNIKKVILKTQQRFKSEVLLKKLTRLLQVQMVIKECNQLIRQQHMNLEWAMILSARQKKLNALV